MTPIWDKAEAHDVSAYNGTPYKSALAAFSKIMFDQGRNGHTPEHIGRYMVYLSSPTWGIPPELCVVQDLHSQLDFNSTKLT